MAKFKNISGEDLIVGPLDGRLVLDGQVFEVPDAVADGYSWGSPFYEAVSEKPSKSKTPQGDDITPED